MRSLDAIKNVGVTSVTIIIYSKALLAKGCVVHYQMCFICATLLSQIINSSRLVM